MDVARRVRTALDDPGTLLERYDSPQARLLCAQLVVLLVPVSLFTVFHPTPLVHPDPETYRRVVTTMVEERTLLATWDPPLRYFLLYVLYVVFGTAQPLADTLAVFQAALFSYLLVPLAVYGAFSTIRSPAAGLAAVVAVTVARVARLPPTAVVWHHWQLDTGYPWAFAALALAVVTVRASEAGDARRTVVYAALTAVTCGLTLNAEPWIALFLVAGIVCAWASHLAVRPLAVAGILGVLASLPLLLIPRWEAHLAIFVVSVVDPYGPLVTLDAFVASVFTPGTAGVLLLFGGGGHLLWRGTDPPGEWVTTFAVIAGVWTWALFTVTTLSGLGTRGLYWALSVGIPAILVQAVDAVPRDHPIRAAYDDLFVRPRASDWAVLLAVEVLLLSFSVWLFVVTYAPPPGR